MEENKRINVMILKKGDLGESVARSFNNMEDDISFEGTGSEKVAIEAVKSGRVDFIASGILGIDWQAVHKEVGSDRLMILTVLNDPRTTAAVAAAGLEFLSVDTRTDLNSFFAAIRKKANRE